MNAVQEFFEAQKTLMSNNRELKKSLIRLAQVGREKRINELTLEELGTLPGDVKTYQSVGKMYGRAHILLALAASRFNTMVLVRRFLLTPKGDITADLQTKIQKADREVQSLKVLSR